MQITVAFLKYSLALTLISLLATESAYGQHNHGRRRVIEIDHDTVPLHDEILDKAPEYLIIRFNDYVRLAKLTLKAEDIKPIDIGFKFDIRNNRVFTQSLPELEPASYYTAEWAAISNDNKMYYGFFCFSFGPGAVVPTSIIEARKYPDSPF